jgi:RND family efflux transporter MFP subunit
MKPIACVIASLILLSGCSKQAPKNQVEAAVKPEPLKVRIAAAETRRVDKSISIIGSLNPDESVNVSAEVAGRISAINVDFGQNVRKGEVIAELDKQEFQIQLDRSRAALAQALAKLGLSPGQEDTPPSSTPAMRQAQAQLDDAKFKYESAAKLVKSGDISQERFTELEKAYRAREAGFEMMRDDMRTILAQAESLRSDVRMAQKHLNDTTIRAPFDGAVMQKMVSPGQYMKENTPIVMLVKTNPLRLRAELPESAAADVHIGTSLTFTTDGIAGREFHAVVRELNPSLDAKSRSLTVEARIAESDSRLRPGMFVQVLLVTRRNADIVVVPKQAIYTMAGLSKVFVIRGGRVVEVRVPPGQELSGWVEVPGDLIRAGDEIAITNLPALVNNGEVKIENENRDKAGAMSYSGGLCRS